MTKILVSHPSGPKGSAETKTATAVGDFSAYKRRAREDRGRRDGMETASLYLQPRGFIRPRPFERWLVLIMGLLFAYTVFCFIALGGWK